ncbi:MAG: UDP-N-acetylmuramoyl-tripeptide--D-alanyl-D-alanine ligase [Acidobacteria bacterium]|nr:UDP-N-acetylmuramoyl-tripeptide--D-alanyl-D-alanine ligase [Acidobacteriota bacterium]
MADSRCARLPDRDTMQLNEIARRCGASHNLTTQLAGTEPAGFAIDSRAVKEGEVFIALPGERVDGHQFVKEVLDRGALAAIVNHQQLYASQTMPLDLGEYFPRLIFVENVAAAIQQMAARVLAAWGRPVVGITASAGKTTMKDLTAQVMAAAGRVHKSLGNLNTSFGLPLTVGRMISGGAHPNDFDLAVFEMGMSSFGEIARLADIASPLVGVVGNAGTAHIEFFGTSERIARAKAELIDGLRPGGTAVLNADDPLVMQMPARRRDLRVIRFGIDAEAEVKARDIRALDQLAGTAFTLVTPTDEAEVKLPLLGRHNVLNALAAAGVGVAFELRAAQIAQQLNAAAPSEKRGEIIRLANGVTIIDDSYNSNPPALLQAVKAMCEAPGFTRRIVVAGEMLELGAEGAAMHKACGAQLAQLGIDELIGVRGLAASLVEGAQAAGLGDATFVETTDEAAALLLKHLRSGDVVLVKGSRGVRTEKIVERLKAV